MRIRTGGQNFYENSSTGRELGQPRSTGLSDVLHRNTSLRTLDQTVYVWIESGVETSLLRIHCVLVTDHDAI